jgi:hypothetical protein
MIVSRLRTSFATSPGLFAAANSNLRRRLTAALRALISTSSSASRVVPRASRFFALTEVLAPTAITYAFRHSRRCVRASHPAQKAVRLIRLSDCRL